MNREDLPAMPLVDIRQQVREEVIARANAELPPDIRQMTPAQCRARLLQMGGASRLVNLREPGQDDEERAAWQAA